MNSYELAPPRVVAATIAIAMAAITMGTMVVLPAVLDGANPAAYAQASAADAVKTPAIASTDSPFVVGDRPASADRGRENVAAGPARGEGHPWMLHSLARTHALSEPRSSN